MAELGNIYAKKIDGSNTLVIDFSQVQINGVNIATTANLTTGTQTAVIGFGTYYTLMSSSSTAQSDETPVKADFVQFINNSTTRAIRLVNPNNWPTNWIVPEIRGSHGISIVSEIGGINFIADGNNSLNNAIFFSHTNPNTFSPTSVRDGWYTLGSNGRRWSQVWAVNGTIQTSDDRLKINEKPITGALKLINNLEYYEYDKVKTPDGTDVTHKERGVIAQHLLNTDLSYTLSGGKTETIKDPNSTETKYIPYGVNYNDLFVTLCSAVKELSAEVNLLKQQIG